MTTSRAEPGSDSTAAYLGRLACLRFTGPHPVPGTFARPRRRAQASRGWCRVRISREGPGSPFPDLFPVLALPGADVVGLEDGREVGVHDAVAAHLDRQLEELGHVRNTVVGPVSDLLAVAVLSQLAGLPQEAGDDPAIRGGLDIGTFAV